MFAAASVQCPKCQATSPSIATFCYRCGASLVGAPAAPGSGGPVEAHDSYHGEQPSAVGPAISPTVQYEIRRDVDRTKTGVSLLGAGALLAWIPVIGFLGGIIALIGAILVIMGRGAFSAKHERNIGIAIVLFIIGVVGALLLAGGVTGTVARAAYMPPGQAEQVIQAAFNGLLVGGIVLGIVAGLASVFFLWELLNLSGRGLILLSYVSAILIACVVFVLIDAQLGGALASAFSATPPDVGPLIALDSQINGLKLLDAIPSLLQAGAAFIAWSRLASGEIPKWHP